MKIALIPPVPDLERYATTDIHLLLSHLFEIPGYLDYYASLSDDYIILDNSAHEFGVGNLPEQLLAQAAMVKADEVVCPDVLFDWKHTADMTRKMFRYITTEEGWAHYQASNLPRLMLVPQGLNRAEWNKCLQTMVEDWDTIVRPAIKTPPVIGVSKDYEPLVAGGLARLIDDCLTPLHKSYKIDVHCLGWPTDLWALAPIVERTPWVRSTDSAKPFVYARAGVRLEPGGPVPEYPHRADDYFVTPILNEDLVRINVEVFKAAATNELILPMR